MIAGNPTPSTDEVRPPGSPIPITKCALERSGCHGSNGGVSPVTRELVGQRGRGWVPVSEGSLVQRQQVLPAAGTRIRAVTAILEGKPRELVEHLGTDAQRLKAFR